MALLQCSRRLARISRFLSLVSERNVQQPNWVLRPADVIKFGGLRSMSKAPSSQKIDISELFVEKELEKVNVDDLDDIVKHSETVKMTGNNMGVSSAKTEPHDDIAPKVSESTVNGNGIQQDRSINNNQSNYYRSSYSKISKMSSSQPLFYQLTKLIESRELNVYSTQQLMVLALRKLLSLTPATDIVPDSSFVMVADYIDILGTQKVLDQLLSVLLHIVIETDLDDSQFGELVINESMFRLRAAPIKAMLDMIQMLQDRQTTDLRKKLYSLAMDGYVSKIEKMLQPSELIEHLRMEHSNPFLHQKLEAIAVQMADKMSPVELYQVLYLHSKSHRKKNGFLISSLKRNLASKPFQLSLAQLKNLFYACASLKINDKELLSRMSIAFEKQVIEEPKSGVVSAIIIPVLKSCSFLGWRHETFSRLISTYIQGTLFNKELSVSDMTSLVLLLGNLNMVEFGPLAAEMVADLGEVREHSPSQWLELVRSLVMMDQAPAEVLVEVLQPEFYERLLDDLAVAPDSKKDSVRCNLLAMLGYLHLQLGEPEAKGPAELIEWREELKQRMSKSSVHGMSLAVNEALNSLAPNDTHTNRNIVTKYGHIVDFEIFVGDNGKARKLDDVSGATRVWIKVQDFSAFLKGGETLVPSRATEICIQHILAENPNTVFVPHAEWVRHVAKRIDQLMYLERKIRECVQVKEIPKMT